MGVMRGGEWEIWCGWLLVMPYATLLLQMCSAPVFGSKPRVTEVYHTVLLDNLNAHIWPNWQEGL